ncbi:glucosaminidase domain-containing protein [Bombilactobacillus bombi]|uniref:glucosaminidase domain-containing protein n=1 Tax=Bombilactobacillus bombi TaxID=1303590 RepID=UPI0035EFAF78
MKKNNLLWSAVLTSATILATLPIQNVKAEIEQQSANQTTNQSIDSNLHNKTDDSATYSTVASNNQPSPATLTASQTNATPLTAAGNAASFSTNSSISQVEFLKRIKAGSINSWQQYQILPSITAAQAILESGWGNSQLAQKYNNLFGIKGSNNGQAIVLPTGEEVNGTNITIDSQFRVYASWDESMADHGIFLNNNSRYHNLLGIQDYRQVAQLLQQDGYATASNYAQALIRIIERNNLQAWDQEVLGNNTSVPTPVPHIEAQANNIESGTYTFKNATNIYTSASTQGKVVGQYQAGQKVVYNGKVQAEGTTWLRYTSYSGTECYVPMTTPVVNPAQTTKSNSKTKPHDTTASNNESGTYTFKNATNIYTSASAHGKVVGQYQAGQKVVYNGKVQAEGTTWLRYTSYSGTVCYVPMSDNSSNAVSSKPKTSVSLPTNNITNETGTYTFKTPTNIYSDTNVNGKVIGQYQVGQQVVYNGKITANNVTWLRYISYSGSICYVPLNNTKQDSPAKISTPKATAPTAAYGTYTFTTTTNIRTSPSLKGKIVGYYSAGQQVFYNGKVVGDGYTWLYYQTKSGATCYVAVIK